MVQVPRCCVTIAHEVKRWKTYPSYSHTPVIKLVLCSAEETLAEIKRI